MSDRSAPSALVTNEERLFALMEPGGNLRVRWGDDATTPDTLSWRKFHAPKTKSPSAWAAFDDSATWAPAHSRVLAPRMIEAAPAPARPRAAPTSSRAEWDQLCAAVSRLLESGGASKVVPAREISFALTKEEHATILGALGARLFAPAIENAYRFVIKSRGSVFFGATPELLFRRENGRIDVPAIAGTQPLLPGVSPEELGRELLNSQKDRIEHQFVVSGVCQALRGIGLDPEAPSEPVILKVPRLLHLHTPVHARDLHGLSSERLLNALHPTAAIGGLPRARAAHFLLENEPFDRGLFSAPLLFRSGSRELCLVAIRSALLTPERLHLFAGAGFVQGSTAEGEWRETEKKIQVMETLLFGEKS